MKRIYFVGAHGAGKTTLARHVSTKFGLSLLHEVVRGMAAELGASLADLRRDLNAVDQFQLNIWKRQWNLESQTITGKGKGFVSDRGFDNLAYAALNARVANDIRTSNDVGGVESYMEYLRDKAALVFYVRPLGSGRAADDGFRVQTDAASVWQVDGMIGFMLEWWGIPYVPVPDASLRDRVRQVDATTQLFLRLQ